MANLVQKFAEQNLVLTYNRRPNLSVSSYLPEYVVQSIRSYTTARMNLWKLIDAIRWEIENTQLTDAKNTAIRNIYSSISYMNQTMEFVPYVGNLRYKWLTFQQRLYEYVNSGCTDDDFEFHDEEANEVHDTLAEVNDIERDPLTQTLCTNKNATL